MTLWNKPALLAALLAGLLLAGASAAAATPPRYVYSPYKHVDMWHDASHAITIAPQGVPVAYIVDGKPAFEPSALTWAFASGECGDEVWGKESAQDIARANVAAFDRAGVGYIISTGGAEGRFTCATDAGMERFISHYDSPHLIGIDLDIEAGQTPAQVDSLIRRVKAAQKKRPHLRFSFTIATHAASDGSLGSLNREAEAVLRAVRRNGLRGVWFNLMVMDYGPGKASACVVRNGVCDMGRSALQAARNAHAKYKIPYAQMELTPMIGVNDVVSNVFTLDDARMLAGAVRSLGLGGLHFWSLDRDTPCSTPVQGASPICSTLDVPRGEYARVLGGAVPVSAPPAARAPAPAAAPPAPSSGSAATGSSPAPR